ncbi:hypothetical protein OY671_009654, partial [Metschnikowia pulcherrima]
RDAGAVSSGGRLAVAPGAGPPPRRPARAAGFTLSEILIASAIVSVASAAVMRTTGMSTTNNGVLRERASALSSAQNRSIESQSAPPASTASGDKAACPQGPSASVCYSRYTDAREGARTVTVEVYLDHRPTPRSATSSGIAGFTLIEVIIAIMIMAIISLISWRAIDSVASTSRKLDQHTDDASASQ